MAIRLRYQALDPVLDERGRRRFAAAEALAAGRGGSGGADHGVASSSCYESNLQRRDQAVMLRANSSILAAMMKSFWRRQMNTKIKFHLPTSAPDQSIFRLVLGRLPRLVT